MWPVLQGVRGGALRAATVVSLSVFLTGCYASAHHRAAYPGDASVSVHAGPPPIHAEVVTVSPGTGYVWVGGYWHWNGLSYAWVPGQYVYAEPGYVWVGPRYVYRGGAHVYVRGYWYHSHRHQRLYGHHHFRRAPRYNRPHRHEYRHERRHDGRRYERRHDGRRDGRGDGRGDGRRDGRRYRRR